VETERAGHVACIGETIDAYRFFGGKYEHMRKLRRNRLRYMDNTNMDFE
jgi:c-di-AMP phosphodiesterase-like protein